MIISRQRPLTSHMGNSTFELVQYGSCWVQKIGHDSENFRTYSASCFADIFFSFSLILTKGWLTSALGLLLFLESRTGLGPISRSEIMSDPQLLGAWAICVYLVVGQC